MRSNQLAANRSLDERAQTAGNSQGRTNMSQENLRRRRNIANLSDKGALST